MKVQQRDWDDSQKLAAMATVLAEDGRLPDGVRGGRGGRGGGGGGGSGGGDIQLEASDSGVKWVFSAAPNCGERPAEGDSGRRGVGCRCRLLHAVATRG